jgi:hypothetical protein
MESRASLFFKFHIIKADPTFFVHLESENKLLDNFQTQKIQPISYSAEITLLSLVSFSFFVIIKVVTTYSLTKKNNISYHLIYFFFRYCFKMRLKFNILLKYAHTHTLYLAFLRFLYEYEYFMTKKI